MSMPAEKFKRMNLAELLAGYAEAPAVPLEGIACDTRRTGEGYLFLAVPGASSHGLQHAARAIGQGAAAVAYDPSGAPAIRETRVPVIAVDGLASHLGDIANRWFGYPSESMTVSGVTGTNGKTTVAWMIADSARRLGKCCAYAGTLGYGIDEIDPADGMTTPDAVEMHRRLAGFLDRGADSAALEVSSHALAQNRVDGVRFDTALFTNLSRDHLDYHGDMRSYGEAKAALFGPANPRHRIINVDSDFGAELAARFAGSAVTVSTRYDRVASDARFVFARSIVARDAGSDVIVQTAWGDGRMSVPLPGDFNVANALLVLAHHLCHDVPLDDAMDALATVAAPPGRMQRVGGRVHTPAVFVDYAHTPAALELALRALKPHVRARLWCVFGCGGERDRGKRPEMGRIAERLADRVVVTSDNPRGESAAAIIDEIVAGMSSPGRATVVADRAAAIAWAIAAAAPDDTILVAGKGHETHQQVGAERLPFSDAGVAGAALAARRRRGAQ